MATRFAPGGIKSTDPKECAAGKIILRIEKAALGFTVEGAAMAMGEPSHKNKVVLAISETKRQLIRTESSCLRNTSRTLVFNIRWLVDGS
jgi:hypothetical protein